MGTTLIEEQVEVEILGKRTDAFDEILTPEALRFLGKLHTLFNDKRKALLKASPKGGFK